MTPPPTSQLGTLRLRLADWTIFEDPAYHLGEILGIPESELSPGVVNSKNPVSDMLYRTLASTAGLGMLEMRDEPDFQYRWNPRFHSA